jgi:large subunit ribosomal protein L21
MRDSTEAVLAEEAVKGAGRRRSTSIIESRYYPLAVGLGAVVSNRKLCYSFGLCGNPSGELFLREALCVSNQEVNMYAVIKTGGKQYRVASGEKIKVEQIAADVGQEIVIDQVLAVGNGSEIKVGTPLVSGATVVATVVAHGKHDKVRIFKMRRRKHYQKRQGHRQQFTELQIGAIAG